MTSALWQWRRYSTCKSFSSALTRQEQGRCNCFRSMSSALSALRKKKNIYLICCRAALSREDMESEAGELYGAPGVRRQKGEVALLSALSRCRPLPQGVGVLSSPTPHPQPVSPLQLIIGSMAPFIWCPSQKWSEIQLELI